MTTMQRNKNIAKQWLVPIAVVLASCGLPDAAGTPTDLDMSADVSPSPRVFVLNTQLRGIINPDITPSAAYGHLQVKLTDNGDDTFSVEWKGRIFNPAAESFITGVVSLIGVNDEVPPGGETPFTLAPVLTMFRFISSDAVSCGIIDFDSDGIINPDVIPAAIAENWIINPEIHEARFSTLEHEEGAVLGTFGIADPTTVLGFNPQPDPPQTRARCAL